MTVAGVQDEFEERARRVAEAQGLAVGYAQGLLRCALNAFLIGGLCVFALWLVWRVAARPLPDSLERSPLVEELREHGRR
jgi:hypothetical protein